MMLFLFLDNAKWYRPVVANLFKEPKRGGHAIGRDGVFSHQLCVINFSLSQCI